MCFAPIYSNEHNLAQAGPIPVSFIRFRKDPAAVRAARGTA